MRTFALLLILAAISAPALAAPPAPATKICLRNADIIGQRVGTESGYFARTRQGWWHNATVNCSGFGPNRFVVAHSFNDQQCRGDVINLVDRSSQINFGACSLGRWEKVPDSAVPPPFNH